MNYIPARAAWLLLGISALVIPGTSSKQGWRIGLNQHAILPGPNPGWSEATMAGLLQCRLIGPIWKNGTLVTSQWIGNSAAAEGGTDIDVVRASGVTVCAAFVAVVIALVACSKYRGIL
jgi:adenosylcobinamide-phosphate synthase